MENEFVKYNEALALKELGFDEPCFGIYLMKEFRYSSPPMPLESITEGVDLLAPLYQQAFRWFREKHGLDSWVYRSNEKLNIWGYNTTLHINVSPFKSHEEAELECLKKLIKIVKEKK